MATFDGGDGALAQAKAHVLAAVMTPQPHPAVLGVGIGRDREANEVVVVLVAGDERSVDEVRALCSTGDTATDVMARVTFRTTGGRGAPGGAPVRRSPWDRFRPGGDS